MLRFEMGGITWILNFVPSNSTELIDRTGRQVLGCTDPITKTIYISNELTGAKRKIVIAHELGHCAMVSYGLIDGLHRLVKPECYIEAEEWACNFLADNCQEVLYIINRI